MFRKTAEFSILLLTVFAWILATPAKASAYTDPGSGAMLWQLLGVTFLSSVFYVRKTLRWIRNTFSQRKQRKDLEQPSPEA